MKIEVFHISLLVAWVWILLGFVSGMVLGMFFQGENWLGGYASLKRRMFRLGHISFFGLGVVNFMFCITVKAFSLAGPFVNLASLAFILGAVAMPICCVSMAVRPQTRLLFSVPVVSLLAGAILTVLEVLHL